jgi:predicted metalloendopeptidase
VDRYFPPEAKAAAKAMVENIRAAYRARLSAVTWLSPDTKAKALAKLEAIKVGVGYPDTWIDYSGLEIVRGEALANRRRAERFDYLRNLAKLHQPVDPAEWAVAPQAVNAIINFSPNSLQFTAGLLQPPYFDPTGDAASNYGSAGAGLAHELWHSFDDLGHIWDERGRLGEWMTAADLAAYRSALQPLARQYDGYCLKTGLCVHGDQVLTESAADLIGLTAAHDAYVASLKGVPDQVKDGLTGEQRFFRAFAQRWRRLQTDEALRQQIATDTHPPGEFRAATVRNLDAWYGAFGVEPGDRLHLDAEKRVRLP